MNRVQFHSALTLVILGTVLLSACPGGGGGTPTAMVSIQATGPTTIDAGQTVSLTATVTNDSTARPGVTWTITSGPGSFAPGSTVTAATFDAPPAANFNASATTVITATSNTDKTQSKTITIAINPTPTVTTTSLTAATEFVTVTNETLVAAGGSGALTWAAAGGTLPPAGLTLNGNGTVTGTPTGPKGNFNFKVTVTDSANPPVISPAASVSIAISWPPSPTIVPASLPSASEGAQYSQTLTVGNGHAPYTITLTGTPPAGIVPSINNAAGTVSFAGIPTGPANVTTNFTVNVTDSSNPVQQGGGQYGILVTPPAPLALGPVSLPDATEGMQYSQNVTASGGIAPYTFSQIANLPAGLSATVTGAVLTIAGKPTGPAGAANFTVTVKDSSNPQQSKSVTYTPNVMRPTAPTLAPVSLPDGMVGLGYHQTLTASGGLPPYAFQVNGLPVDGLSAMVNATTVVVSGTPTSAQTGLLFTVTVVDSSNPTYSVPANYSININNTPPACVLLGQFAFLGTGTASGGGSSAIAGSVSVAHDGTVTGAIDFKTHTFLATNQTISQGTCTNGQVPNTGELVFVVAGNVTETIKFALRTDGVRALIEWQDSSGTIGSGQMEKQTAPTVNFHGSYGWGIEGEDGSAGRMVAIGAFCSNNLGDVGYLQADIDDNNGTNNQFMDNKGTTDAQYPLPDANGRTQMTSPFTFINGNPAYEFTLTMYVINQGKAFAVETSPLGTSAQVLGGVISGQGGGVCLASPGSFTNASLKTSVFALRGHHPTKGIEATVGLINNIDSIHTTASLTVDTNQGGATESFADVAATYVLTPGGHVTISYTDPNTGKAGQVLLYLDGVGDGYVLAAGKAIDFGATELQAVGPFNDQSIGGTYVAGSLFVVPGQTTLGIDAGTVDNTHRTIQVLGSTTTGTYQMDLSGSGRGTAVFTSPVPFGSTNATFYVYGPNKIAGIGTMGDSSPFVVRLEQ